MNVSLILLICIEQARFDEADVINRDDCSVSHDYPMLCTIQFFDIPGDRHITVSGFFIVRQEIGDCYARLFLDMLPEDGGKRDSSLTAEKVSREPRPKGT